MCRRVITIESRDNPMNKPPAKSPAKSPVNWTNDPATAKRYAPIHDMVTAVLAKVEPDGYAKLRAGFRDEWKPEGAAIHIVDLMADAAFRLDGCAYLEAEILNGNLERCKRPDETAQEALGRAFVLDCEGPNLLEKLSRYEKMLSRAFAQCSRTLHLRAKNRRMAEARMAQNLARLKPCTSVIQ